VGPALDAACAEELARQVGERWRPEQLCSLLNDQSHELRRVSCVVLGLIGNLDHARCLAAALRDEDRDVNELAEQAMWSIFFRSGGPGAIEPFKLGLAAMEHNDPAAAAEHFRRACKADGQFAEAFNQCGIAHYMLEAYEASLADCQRAVALVPIHFGALAGVGHCHAQLGDLRKAAEAYRRALNVNPHMEGIANVLQRVERCLSKSA
jgi:tetratricopeptide (TPR) repeat protein